MVLLVQAASFAYGIIFSSLHYYFVRITFFSQHEIALGDVGMLQKRQLLRLFVFIPIFVLLAFWLHLSILYMILGMIVATIICTVRR